MIKLYHVLYYSHNQNKAIWSNAGSTAHANNINYHVQRNI